MVERWASPKSNNIRLYCRVYYPAFLCLSQITAHLRLCSKPEQVVKLPDVESKKIRLCRGMYCTSLLPRQIMRPDFDRINEESSTLFRCFTKLDLNVIIFSLASQLNASSLEDHAIQVWKTACCRVTVDASLENAFVTWKERRCVNENASYSSTSRPEPVVTDLSSHKNAVLVSNITARKRSKTTP